MTAEVVVMNRVGVALAADSAVTVEMGGSTKVRDSALKLFTLSKYRPVGVMIYNNASLLGVPLETIIKLFRRDLGRTGFETLGEYGEALINFLDGNTALFPEATQERYFLQALKTEYLRIDKLVKDELVDRGLYGKEEHGTEVAEKAISKRLDFWRAQKKADYFNDICAKDILGRISGEVHKVVNDTVLSWSVSREAVGDLNEIAKHLIAKDYIPPDVFSGLVIAGFGEMEHFPVVQHLEIGGIYGGKLKVRPYTVTKVSDEKSSHVMAFAYQNMVDTFLYGISPSLYENLNDAVVFINKMPVLALDAVTGLAPEDKEKAVKVVRRESAAMAKEFARTMLHKLENRWKEITIAVDALTIKELAQVASTLVDLSSFEQQMSLDSETVGGPVDVAVISKGDGFIWIDRKHYFKRELNQNFFQNYYNDEEEVQNGE